MALLKKIFDFACGPSDSVLWTICPCFSLVLNQLPAVNCIAEKIQAGQPLQREIHLKRGRTSNTDPFLFRRPGLLVKFEASPPSKRLQYRQIRLSSLIFLQSRIKTWKLRRNKEKNWQWRYNIHRKMAKIKAQYRHIFVFWRRIPPSSNTAVVRLRTNPNPTLQQRFVRSNPSFCRDWIRVN